MVMAEYFCLHTKDTQIPKPSKRSRMFSRMVVFMFTMIFGVYICSICLKQISIPITTNFLSIEGTGSPFLHDTTNPKGIYRKHFPIPKTFRRAECARNPVNFFVIVSMQRSGSGWFESLLNSHANVSSNGEIFSVLDRRKNISSIMQTLDKVYNLDWLSSASKNQCSAAVGFKWMLNQGLMEHHDIIAEYFNRRGVSAIFIFRKNLLRRMVSILANSYDRYAKSLNGTHKAHVHSQEEAKTLSNFKPIINALSLITDLEEMKATASKALHYFNSTRHIILYYEDLIKNQTKLKDVQEFLDLPQMELTSHQVKIHNGLLLDHITNWDDVNKTLVGTPYESFLHADK